jgi:cell division protein FtsL
LENIEENLAKVPLRDISQSPLAYALYVVVIVLVGVIIGQRVSASTDKNDCAQMVTDLQNQVKAERSEKDEIFKAYFVERSANQQIQKAVDSTAIINFKSNGK